ncbi:MAG TPA: cupin domain-containing protein, partial [Baekduia sp.]|nr:cupin domain-containing protein [Baekduia sp.]
MDHPNVSHWDAVAPTRRELGDLRSARRRLGPAVGTASAGLSRWDIAPGSRSTPVHVHADEEELVYVLRGDGLSWQDGRT